LAGKYVLHVPASADLMGAVVGPTEAAVGLLIMVIPEQVTALGNGANHAVTAGEDLLHAPTISDLAGVVVGPAEAAVAPPVVAEP